MEHNIYLYIFVAAAVSCLIRVLPLTLIRGKIKNPFLRSFLFLCAVCHARSHDVSCDFNGSAGSACRDSCAYCRRGSGVARCQHDWNCRVMLRRGVCL